MDDFSIKGNLVDITGKDIYPVELLIKSGCIIEVRKLDEAQKNYIMPGFIDAHIHIESSMLVPAEFAKAAACHGTVATVSDPHEIANVLGVPGVDYMIENGKTVPFHFFFGAPSCVPATSFETSGAVIDSGQVQELLMRDDIWYLSEMMNFPGVLHQDAQVLAKLAAAQKLGKPIDGHAPGLRGEAAERYFSQGITTDHECFTLEEAMEKAALGVKILIREGSAARNFDSLIPTLKNYPGQVMFCSDDKHPDDLIRGHIQDLAAKAIELGYDFYDVLHAACLAPIEHYQLPVGSLRSGDPADFIVVENLRNFKHVATYYRGIKTAEHGKPLIETRTADTPNNCIKINLNPEAIQVIAKSEHIRCIEAIDGELITESFIASAKISNGLVVADPAADILKIVVVNRYRQADPAIGFIRGFGLRHGAIASTVAHDSHNIIAVGVDDQSICRAINLLSEHGGGICVCADTDLVLPLPVAGLMSTEDAWKVASKYETLDRAAKQLGSSLRAPFMTLSFMALLVIPSLKMSDLGLFDGTTFQFVDLQDV